VVTVFAAFSRTIRRHQRKRVALSVGILFDAFLLV
jgi:hypothetical protein